MNIILIGYRCTGKTQTGRRLAARLGLDFYDTDEIIVRRMGRSVEAIVAEGGWPTFREAERAVIAGLAETDRSVISLGGGAVLDPENVERLKGNGLFVRLTADAATIAARMANDPANAAQRPSLTGSSEIEEIEKLLAQREPIYLGLAAMTADTTTGDVEKVVETLCAGLRNKIPRAVETPARKEQ
jgi:shikimate kinase